MGDKQSQFKTGSDQSASHSADVPDCGCQELDHNEQVEDKMDRGINPSQDENIDQDEGIDQDVEVDRPIDLEELSDLACNENIKTAMD